MAVDTIIQYNGRNSYRVTSTLWSYPFGVEGSNFITHSFRAYCDQVQSAGVRAKTKFIDEHGDMLSEVTHSFAVGLTFDDLQEITVAVPVGAMAAQLCLLQGGRTWWIAEPKSEPGEVATPFNVNYQGQLTFIGPTGVYTGMITTGQIVVAGSVSNPDEKLDERLITINNKMINLEAAIPSVGGIETRVTAIEAGQITLSSRVGNVEPRVTRIGSDGIYTGSIEATQITAGKIKADRIDLTNLFAQNVTATGSITGAKMYSATISDSATSNFYMTVGDSKTVINGSSYYYDALALYEYKIDPTPFFSIAGVNGHTYMQYKNGQNFLWTTDNGINLRNDNGFATLSLRNNSVEISFGSGAGYQGSIGIDSGGAYWTMGASHSGQKTYFKNM